MTSWWGHHHLDSIVLDVDCDDVRYQESIASEMCGPSSSLHLDANTQGNIELNGKSEHAECSVFIIHFLISIWLILLLGRKKHEHDCSRDDVATDLGKNAVEFPCNVISDKCSKSPILKDDEDICVSVDVESLKNDVSDVVEKFEKLKGEISLEKDSYIDFVFVSMRASFLDASEKEYYRKNSAATTEQDHVDDIFDDINESQLATITQDVIDMMSTKSNEYLDVLAGVIDVVDRKVGSYLKGPIIAESEVSGTLKGDVAAYVVIEKDASASLNATILTEHVSNHDAIFTEFEPATLDIFILEGTKVVEIYDNAKTPILSRSAISVLSSISTNHVKAGPH
ncbi:hypothetical protein H5410_036300 [Solanum commersonii]|uniref:Uncharacterized protein n=1 Tax=Solanum commersonii TaxID=4109 RepID=A0A9J5Y737_SOLCO|nr:hypothetical protein H5410_036300 [Solanum commersonii]